jgi:Response regulator containing CheY-like receiver, AAA-type ATPase, and DNA-binding domains
MTAVSKGSVIDESSIPGYLKKINQKKETYSDSGGKDFIKIPFGISLEDAENIIIKKTLEINGFNKAKTANDLKIGLKTVYRKLEKN